MNLILVMSISGSLVFLLYLLMKPMANRWLSAHWQYNFLKICILFYLIPYQYFQDEYLRFYNRNFGSGEDINPLRGDTLVFKNKNTIYITPDGRLHYEYWLPLLISVIVWLLIIGIFLFINIRKYHSFRKQIVRLSEIPNDDTLDTATEKQHAILQKNRKQAQILQCSYTTSPVAVGLFKPIVILPKQNNIKDTSLYLAHELYHVRNHDVLWKFLAFFTILLHWFNPLVYLLFIEIGNASEKYCDEKVTNSLSETEKVHYGDLIIDAAQREHDASILLADSFIKNNKQAKERIEFMTRETHKITHWKLMTALAACLAILSMPMSVLAYEPFYTYETAEYDSSADVMYILPPDTESPLIDDCLMNLDFTLSDEILIDEFGNQYVITPGESQTAKSCAHEYVNTTKNVHEKTGNDCIIYVYEGTYCKKCGYCANETYIRQISFSPCPH